MSLPLSDVRIADFSWVGAGPRATKDLADYGATVVKIESRKRLDLGRLSPPFANDKRDPDGSAFFAITNTSKKSVSINLNDPEGIEVAKALVAWADVVVENFSPGFMDRIGLSYDTLRSIKPDIIVASVSVAGRHGPLGKMRGYGNTAAAQSGLASLCGWSDRDPHMPPFAYGDVVAPMFATVAILAALEHRRQTGEGQHLDISQTEPLIHTMADVYARHQDHHTVDKPENRSARYAPQGAFPCRGQNQYIAISITSDAQWRALCEAMPLTEGRDYDIEQRRAHEQPIHQAIAHWTRDHDKHVLADTLCDLGIPAEAVADGRDVFTDPELIQNHHYVPIDHPKLGHCDMPAPPVKFSTSDIRVERPPCLGEHLYEVLEHDLGISKERIQQWVDSGALA